MSDALLNYHQTVLLKEAIDFLQVKPGKWYVDATIGGGGHSLEIIKRGGKVLGLDCDQEAIDFTSTRFALACPQNAYILRKGNFSDLENIVRQEKIGEIYGILFDLGSSRHQLKTSGRGFSFYNDEPLDMRMDKDLQVTAALLLKVLTEKELVRIFEDYGEEPLAKKIAREIVRKRLESSIETTGQLARIVEKIYVQHYRSRSYIHPATKIFQALRIVVNSELENLENALPQTFKLLETGGVIAVISFHGLEDKIVKNYFKTNKNIKILTKKPIIPKIEEIKENPSSRSAKLRAGEKT